METYRPHLIESIYRSPLVMRILNLLSECTKRGGNPTAIHIREEDEETLNTETPELRNSIGIPIIADSLSGMEYVDEGRKCCGNCGQKFGNIPIDHSPAKAAYSKPYPAQKGLVYASPVYEVGNDCPEEWVLAKKPETLRIPTVSRDGNMPEFKTDGAGAADLRYSGKDPIILQPYTTPADCVALPTGIFMAIPKGYVGLVFIRSSVGKSGLELVNATGFVDEDYRGEIFLCVRNMNSSPRTIEPNERIGQLFITPRVLNIEFAKTDSLDETSRGEGGWGSTGKQ